MDAYVWRRVQVLRCGQYASSKSAVTAMVRHDGCVPGNGFGRSIAPDHARVKRSGPSFSGQEFTRRPRITGFLLLAGSMLIKVSWCGAARPVRRRTLASRWFTSDSGSGHGAPGERPYRHGESIPEIAQTFPTPPSWDTGSNRLAIRHPQEELERNFVAIHRTVPAPGRIRTCTDLH